MNLKKGSKGTEVEELQRLLNDSGNYGLKTDGIFGDKTLAAVKDYQQKNGLAVDGIAGAKTLGKLKVTGTTPTAAPVVNTATPSAPTVTAPQGVTAPTQNKSYADQVNAAIAQILERKPMQYNFNGDPLYQMYKDSALAGSQTASADAMARAAALTGGYGNSYAATVANQAAQQQMAGLNEKIPELEQLARARYDAETSRLMNNYGILADLENQEYTRKWNEDQRKYERDQDKLAREDEAYARKLQLAQLAAQYGDTSRLKELGVDTSKYVVGGDAPIDDGKSKWIYEQYLSHMEADPPYDDATATRWAQNIVNAYLDGRLEDDEYFTLIDKYSNVKRIAQEYARRKKNELTANESMTMPTPDLIAKLNEWQKEQAKKK